jgi:Mrp family chromosome partitioning ATPase
MSRTFELLRQAQRDQALLKQSTQVTATNSRNFEVLHQAGKDQKLFETEAVAPATKRIEAVQSASTVPTRGHIFRLVQKLFLAPDAPSPRVLAFASVEQGSEHGRISTRVAELLAEYTQASVCIVDANLATPSLHRHLGVANVGGLAPALTETGPVKTFLSRVGHGHLYVMTAGKPTSGPDWSDLLTRGGLRARVSELRASFDYVLITAPPAVGKSGPAYLGSLGDGVVLVVEPSFTPREAAREMKEEIEASGGRVLGVVLHRRELTLRDRTGQTRGRL